MGIIAIKLCKNLIVKPFKEHSVMIVTEQKQGMAKRLQTAPAQPLEPCQQVDII